MQQLPKDAAELAQHLIALCPGPPYDTNELNAVEQLARIVLQEVSAAKRGDSYTVGEISGQWPAFNARRPH